MPGGQKRGQCSVFDVMVGEDEDRPVDIDSGGEFVDPASDPAPVVTRDRRVDSHDPNTGHVEAVHWFGKETSGLKRAGGIDGLGSADHIVVAGNGQNGNGNAGEQFVEHLPLVGVTLIGDVALDHQEFRPPKPPPHELQPGRSAVGRRPGRRIASPSPARNPSHPDVDR